MEYYLPDEMVMEILSRLPVSSILRFKCVSKSWYVLLTSPNFVSKHLSIQLQSDMKNLMCLKRMIWDEDDDYTEDGSLIPTMSILSKDNVHDPLTFYMPSNFDDYGLDMIGHCDGLIVFSNCKECILVCNPAIRVSRILPDSFLLPIPCDDEDDGLYRGFDCGNFLGFGYDSATNDYKIVRAVNWYKNGDTKIIPRVRVEVFCIHSDSCWRELNIILDSPSLGTLGDYEIREPYLNGVYYWWAKDHVTDQHVLVSFHMAHEVFRKTTMPTLECFEHSCTEVSLGVYNESIALFILAAKVQDCIDIWVMNEVGVKVSWSKQLTIKPFMGVHFTGFWNGSDKEFLYVDRYEELAIYNRVTMVSKTLSLQGVSDTWAAVPYLKTIVSVNSRLTPAVTRKRKQFSSQEEEGEDYYDDINKS